VNDGSPAASVEAVVEEVRRRCNRLVLRDTLVRVGAVAVGVAAGCALVWVLRGDAVPLAVFAVAAGVGAVVAAGLVYAGWHDSAAAGRVADEVFGLKDGVGTAMHLGTDGAGGELERMQRRWTEERLGRCDLAALRRPWPRRWLAAGMIGLLAALWLGTRPPSAARLAEIEAERETRKELAAAKEAIEELIEEIEEEIVASPEQEVLEMDEFRKLVEEIEETGDRTAAARQFARIEQKVREAARALGQRRDEETLALAAKELAKAEESEPRQLGKQLEKKDWREAKEKLEKLEKMKKLDPGELKDAEKLDEARKRLAKMRAVTKRLAAAGRQRQAGANAAGAMGGAAAGAGGRAGGLGAAGGAAGEGGALEDLLAEIDEEAREMEELLGELEFDPDAEWLDEDFDGPLMRFNGKLDLFAGRLGRMHGRARALDQLERLRAALGRAQGQQMLGLAQAAGGRQPGRGSAWHERKERDDSQDQGQLAQLSGQHGEGPSLSAVEEAASGTGVSGRRGEAREREFSRQVESFVQRDDVPEALKLGVRNYFENLQAGAAVEAPAQD